MSGRSDDKDCMKCSSETESESFSADSEDEKSYKDDGDFTEKVSHY